MTIYAARKFKSKKKSRTRGVAVENDMLGVCLCSSTVNARYADSTAHTKLLFLLYIQKMGETMVKVTTITSSRELLA